MKQSTPSVGDEVRALTRISFVPEIKAIDVDQRTITHLISTASIDRAGDMVEPLGWDLANFKRNPVVLADHSYTIDRIIGRAENVEASKEGLTATTRFDDLGLGAQAFRLISEGFLKAFSVGFKPKIAHSVRAGVNAKCERCEVARDSQVEGKSPEEIERVFIRGTHFIEQELLEYSAVAVPMQPDAVLNAIKSGIIDRDAVPIFFSVDANRSGVESLVNKILTGSPPSTDVALHGAKASRVSDMYGILERLDRGVELRIVEETIKRKDTL